MPTWTAGNRDATSFVHSPKCAPVLGRIPCKADPVLLQGLTERMTPGYAIGGLAGGEEKNLFVRVVSQVRALLSAHQLLLPALVLKPLLVYSCIQQSQRQLNCVLCAVHSGAASRSASVCDGNRVRPFWIPVLNAGDGVGDARYWVPKCCASPVSHTSAP